MKDPKAEGQRWLEQAQHDLSAARTIYASQLWWVACFQAQQAAEKAVKAFLYFSGERIVLGHSVVELVSKAGKLEPEFNKLKSAAASLDRFYIPTRYPNSLPGGIPAEAYTEDDAKRAVELAADVVECVLGLASVR